MNKHKHSFCFTCLSYDCNHIYTCYGCRKKVCPNFVYNCKSKYCEKSTVIYCKYCYNIHKKLCICGKSICSNSARCQYCSEYRCEDCYKNKELCPGKGGVSCILKEKGIKKCRNCFNFKVSVNYKKFIDKCEYPECKMESEKYLKLCNECYSEYLYPFNNKYKKCEITNKILCRFHRKLDIKNLRFICIDCDVS